MNKTRDIFNKRGSETIRSVGKIFRQMNSYDGNNKINKDEYILGLREVGAILTKNELDILCNYFDKDCEGYVNFEEFLIGIRGKPNQRRQAIIDKAFLKLDKEGNGLIDVTDLRTIFNCSKHPKVVNGEMGEEQVFALF